MQDRYAGDVGDFGKLGLLRKIAGRGFRIGVNWYHTFKPEEHGRGDGKYTSRHRNAQEALAQTDIIFCDPDNGLLVKSVSLTGVKSDKYVITAELLDYYQAGKSVIFYNHRGRERKHRYLQRFTPLKKLEELAAARFSGLTFMRGSLRDYIFLIQPPHFDKIKDAINCLLQTNWSRHFTILNGF